MQFIILLAVFSFFIFFVLGLLLRIRKEKKQRKDHEELITHTVKERFQSFMKVGGFLQHSKFINPIASWKGEKIYQFILNDGFLYEFYEILPEEESKIEINEKALTFNQMLYLRSKDHDKFLNGFSKELNEEEVTILKDFSQINSQKENADFDAQLDKLNKNKEKLAHDKENKISEDSQQTLLNPANSESLSQLNISNSINAYVKNSNISSSNILVSKEEDDFVPDTVEPLEHQKESKFKHFLNESYFKIKAKLKKK